MKSQTATDTLAAEVPLFPPAIPCVNRSGKPTLSAQGPRQQWDNNGIVDEGFCRRRGVIFTSEESATALMLTRADLRKLDLSTVDGLVIVRPSKHGFSLPVLLRPGPGAMLTATFSYGPCLTDDFDSIKYWAGRFVHHRLHRKPEVEVTIDELLNTWVTALVPRQPGRHTLNHTLHGLGLRLYGLWWDGIRRSSKLHSIAVQQGIIAPDQGDYLNEREEAFFARHLFDATDLAIEVLSAKTPPASTPTEP